MELFHWNGNNCDWGDYDNDGDLDIVLSGREPSDNFSRWFKIYRNDGEDVFIEIDSLNIHTNYISGASVAWGDCDNDGDLDILYGVVILRNDGENSFSTVRISDWAYFEGTWGDYDNDGDLDILSAWKTMKLIRNDGNCKFTTVIEFEDYVIGEYISDEVWQIGWGDIEWGDYDNDGDLDILCTGTVKNSVSHLAVVLRNEQNDSFTDINAGLCGVYNSSAKWGDYDNDGDFDIFLTGVEQNNKTCTKLYLNDNDSFAEEGIPTLGRGSIALA